MMRYFKGGITTLGSMFFAFAVLFGILIAFPNSTMIENITGGVMGFLFCFSPLVLLFTMVTGIGALVQWSNKNTTEKKKRDDFSDFGAFDDFDFSDEVNMEGIMARLTPEQQDYLQQQLRNQRLGLGNDGELTSMDDLLDRFEDDSQR